MNEVLRDRINQADIEKIKSRKDEILTRLKEIFDEATVNVTEGSYARHTYVDGLSDIDFLIDLGKFSESSIENKDNSQAILNLAKERLEKLWPDTDISQGKMAVTIKFSDGIELQVLPAFKYFSGYKVPDPDGKGWVCTFPNKFRSTLTDLNKKNANSIVPCIKITKALMNNKGIEIKSYHLENIALDAFKSYNGIKTKRDMVLHLLSFAKTAVLYKTGDPCGQSEHVDDYLGGPYNNKRNSLATRIRKLYTELEKSENKESWENILD